MLKFWTGAAQHDIDVAVGETIRWMQPAPAHQIVPFKESELVKPEPGEIVVAMGAKPYGLIQQAGLVPKNRTLSGQRGKAIDVTLPAQGINKPPGRYMLTFDPFNIHVDEQAALDIAWDIRLADRLLRTGSLAPVLGVYKWVSDFDHIISQVDVEFDETKKPVAVAMDLETLGLVPFLDHAWIITIGFSAKKGTGSIMHFPSAGDKPTGKVLDQIKWLLTSKKVKLWGANLKFDLIWMAVKWGIGCTNFMLDTMLAGTLINENVANSLNTHAKIYTDLGGYDDPFNAKYEKSRMDLVPKDELLTYAGGDLDAVLHTGDLFAKRMNNDQQLRRFYQYILHPGARAFERIEARGLCVNKAKLQQCGSEMEKEFGQLEKEMLEIVGSGLRAKHAEKIADQMASGKSPFTSAILTEFFFSKDGLNLKPIMRTEKTSKPSTAHEHLVMFADVPEAKEFVGRLKQSNSTRKMHSTYVKGFLKHLRPDGLFHPTYMLFKGPFDDSDEADEAGTVSGRTSVRDPALQTLPKYTAWAKRMRKCYEAPPGKVFWQADYEQGELKIAACIAGEEKMIAAYKQGIDLHTITGAKLTYNEYNEVLKLKETNKDLFDKIRQTGKSGNFGLLYEMSASGLVDYARKAYGVIMTMEEAEDAIKAFFDLYPGLKAWHKQSVALARRDLLIRSPLGRIRHLPLIKSPVGKVRSHANRQAINSPVQATLSDMAIWAISIIELELDACSQGLYIGGMTHDSVYGYVDEDRVVEGLKLVVGVMSNLPLEKMGWHPPLQFTADCETGPDLGTLTKMKLAA